MSEIEIQVGDFVHATLYNANTDAVLIQQFVVTETDGIVFRGGELDCDISGSWTVELISKGLSNLNLPSTISEIIATDKRGKTHALVGKNETWRDQDGALFDVANIVSWVPETE